MPQHIAETDPFKQFTEVVGSGPFRFKADERVQGSLFVYERFDKYQPREDGEAASPPVRRSCISTASSGTCSRIPPPRPRRCRPARWTGGRIRRPICCRCCKKAKIDRRVTDPTGTPFLLRPNHLYPPFDKPAVRRALMGAIDQKEFMIAMQGEDTSLWSVPCGFFPPVSPLASDAGMSALTGKRDYDAVKTALEKAGYAGREGGDHGGDRPAG